MKRLLATLTLLLTSVAHLQAVTIPTVPIGNPGNANDPQTGNLYGGVSYDYRIGATEVTNAQYAEFLNAKAASDPLALYSSFMGSSTRGGITRSGVDGSFIYNLRSNMGDKPVNFVSGNDAFRFANWLHNGQGAGDTESGAYTILGGTPIPSNALSITRNAGAIWFVPSEDEWYKAAYHQPASQGGDVDGYWQFPTASNQMPINAMANSSGDISNPGKNVINYQNGADWNGQNGNVTTVGSAGPLSRSFYGTSDQGGNVYERVEEGEVRGGSWNSSGGIRSFETLGGDATGNGLEHVELGFRVATVPEPSTYALAAMGFVTLVAVRRRCYKPARLA